VREFLRHIFTGADNHTFDIGRVFAGAFGSGALFFQAWHVIANHAPFSMQDFGIGAGALAAGIGAMLNLKRDTEPKDRA